jgi:hypothetical protein
MLISGCAGNGTGEAANNGAYYGSLSVAHYSTNHCSGGSATADDGGSPAIVAGVIIIAVTVNGSPVDRRGRVNISWARTMPVVDAIAIPSIIISEVATPVIAPLAITSVASRLVLHSGTVLVAVFGSHGWKTGTNKSDDGADRNKFLNAFHKCLRL